MYVMSFYICHPVCMSVPLSKYTCMSVYVSDYLSIYLLGRYLSREERLKMFWKSTENSRWARSQKTPFKTTSRRLTFIHANFAWQTYGCRLSRNLVSCVWTGCRLFRRHTGGWRVFTHGLSRSPQDVTLRYPTTMNNSLFSWMQNKC